jgi:hypothetical protein
MIESEKDSFAEEGVQMFEDKAIVNAEDAVRSIRSGMTDEALMEKYEISQKGLESLFRKLIAAGAIERSELDRRRGSLHRPDRTMSLRNPHCFANVENEDEEAMATIPEDRSIWEVYKHYFSAVGGAFVGGLFVFLGMTFLGDAGPSKSSKSPPLGTPAVIADKWEPAQAEHLGRILESIANDERAKGYFESHGNASEYEDCLNDCANSFGVGEQPDKALLTSCRRECVIKYAERVKEMRKRFYENQDPP